MNIKNPEAQRLAAELATLRGTSITAAVTEALRSQLERERGRKVRSGLAEELDLIRQTMCEPHEGSGFVAGSRNDAL